MSDNNSLIRKYTANHVSGTPVRAITETGANTFYNMGGRRDQPGWVALNEFRSTYFSGLDISVYAGGIFLDEVIQLQFSEMEQVRPMFGYSDYTFRDVVHGSRIVQGSFSINFKDSGYIPKLMERLRNPMGVDEAVKSAARLQAQYANSTHNQELQYLNQDLTEPPDQLSLSRDLTLEDIVNTSTGKSGPEYNQKRYAALMDSLKTRHWGTPKAPDGSSYTQNTATDPDRKAKYQPARDMLGFDLVIKYGQPEDYEGGRPGWGTIEVIKDCNITGFSKSIDDSGRNIVESYQFLARTLA